MIKRLLSFLFALSVLTGLFWLSGCSGKAALLVTVLAVGKADCIVLETERCVVMIDTAEKENLEEIESFLQSRGIRAINVLILTHFDKDHVGCAAEMIRSYGVKTVYQSAFAGNNDEYDDYLAACVETGLEPQRLTEDVSFSLDGVDFTVSPPEKTSYSKNEDNNSSLITSCFSGDSSLLFCGDAMEERMEEFMSRNTRNYDLVKLPHHGSLLGNYEKILDELCPKIAVITCSEKNPEDPGLAALLEKRGVLTCLTRGGNTVSVRVTEAGLSVSN